MVDPAKVWPFPLSSGPIVKKSERIRHASPDPAASELTRYQGGKNGAGVYQKIINAIPPHREYVEPFAGSAAIFRRKKPAASSFLYEADHAQSVILTRELRGPGVTVICGDGLKCLQRWAKLKTAPDTFFYIDPPYLHSTRRDANLYKHELTDEQHVHLVTSLLPALTAAGALWMLSGYMSNLYSDAALRNRWWTTAYQAQTRRGVVTEYFWTNYDPTSIVPADLKFTGSNFRERERLKRKAARWVNKLRNMPATERAFIRAALATIDETGDAVR